MKLAILGCGPSGLLATHAAVQLGHDPVIYSIAEPSRIHGAQYLHRAIPEITGDEPETQLRFRRSGFPRIYAYKIYRNPIANTSWDKFDVNGLYPAWNMMSAYKKLWDLYESVVINRIVNSWDIPDLLASFPQVISTIPAPNLCRKSYHEFTRAFISVAEYAPPIVKQGEIMYNGRWKDDWYRACDIFGHRFTEYPDLVPGLSNGFKPISTNCDCFQGRVLKIGRFGKWAKGELTHHAYEETISHLEFGGQRALHSM